MLIKRSCADKAVNEVAERAMMVVFMKMLSGIGTMNIVMKRKIVHFSFCKRKEKDEK